jgi:hypothetical protein
MLNAALVLRLWPVRVKNNDENHQVLPMIKNKTSYPFWLKKGQNIADFALATLTYIQVSPTSTPQATLSRFEAHGQCSGIKVTTLKATRSPPVRHELSNCVPMTGYHAQHFPLSVAHNSRLDVNAFVQERQHSLGTFQAFITDGANVKAISADQREHMKDLIELLVHYDAKRFKPVADLNKVMGVFCAQELAKIRTEVNQEATKKSPSWQLWRWLHRKYLHAQCRRF